MHGWSAGDQLADLALTQWQGENSLPLFFTCIFVHTFIHTFAFIYTKMLARREKQFSAGQTKNLAFTGFLEECRKCKVFQKVGRTGLEPVRSVEITAFARLHSHFRSHFYRKGRFAGSIQKSSR